MERAGHPCPTVRFRSVQGHFVVVDKVLTVIDFAEDRKHQWESGNPSIPTKQQQQQYQQQKQQQQLRFQKQPVLVSGDWGNWGTKRWMGL